MESHWVKVLLFVFGILFAVGGAVSAFLQAKWLRDQRQTLRKILEVLQITRGHDIKKGTPMKVFAVMVLVTCLLGVLNGCHSGIMRGAGSDVGRLGDAMQR